MTIIMLRKVLALLRAYNKLNRAEKIHFLNLIEGNPKGVEIQKSKVVKEEEA